MYSEVREYIEKNNMLAYGDGVVIGISGGADSVCLLHVMKALSEGYGLRLAAVHVNHMIRGEEADADEAYVRELCNKMDIGLDVYKKDIRKMAGESGLTVEEAGRNYRYTCFRETKERYGMNKIAVAHNLDDRAETVLFNLIRGSSIRGLAGIRPVRDDIIRPLLGTSRTEIEDYLSENSLEYRTDSTNLSTDYDRNVIRHIILPEMKKINTAAVEHICRAAEESEDVYEAIDLSAEDLRIKQDEKGGRYLEIKELLKKPVYIQREIILKAMGIVAGRRKDLTFIHVESVRNLLEKQSGAQLSLPYNMRARISYGELIIEKNPEDMHLHPEKEGAPAQGYPEAVCINTEKSGKYQIGGRQFTVEKVLNKADINISSNPYEEIVNCDKIGENLTLRMPEAEDYIIINAQGARKKLARLFTDKKLDREKRKTWPVFAVGNEIIWAVGLRLSEACRINDDTEDMVILRYEGGSL